MSETPPENRVEISTGPVPARMPRRSGFVHGARKFVAWLFGIGALALWGAAIWWGDWRFVWLSFPVGVAALITDPGGE